MSKQIIGNGQETGGCDVYVEDTESGDRHELDPRLNMVNHSPDGFQWGYSGSGPAQLAFAILMELYDDEEIAHEHYQEFKDDVISSLTGGEDFLLSQGEVYEWMEKRKQRGDVQ